MSFFTVDAHPAGRAEQEQHKRTAEWIGKMDAHILQTNVSHWKQQNSREQPVEAHIVQANGSHWKREPLEAHILQANGSHWKEQHSRQQPMLLSAWTQTTGEDFQMLRSLDNDTSHFQAENRALQNKVLQLESKLKEQSDILSQIHATSARLQRLESTVDDTPPPPYQPQILTPPNSVICSTQSTIQSQSQRNVTITDYKIISADCNDADAIEIRLAAESLNSLSTSADSDRLEICLNEEQNPLQLIKRRKLETSNTTPVSSPLQTQQTPNTYYKVPPRRSNQKIKEEAADQVMVSIGPNNTCVPAHIFENINWSVSSLATRKLLVAIFDRETLATHSMTGKPSPAFKDQHKPLKQMLDPLKIQDIIFAVTHKSNASEKEVRNAITTKCADENKMMKIQKGKRCSIIDKENIST